MPFRLLSLVVLALGSVAQAQPDASGRDVAFAQASRSVYLERFGPSDYGAHNQNWTVLQDTRGVLFVGNNSGIVSYDGEAWEQVHRGVDTVRGLARDTSGQIYVGSRADIGRLVTDGASGLQYESLASFLAEDQRAFADVWTTEATADGVFFQTAGQVMRWNGDAFHVWTTPTRYRKAFAVHGRYFVHEEGVGLLEAQGDSLHLVPDGGQFAAAKIEAMVARGAETLLWVRGRGFVLWDLTSDRYRTFETEADAHLQTHRTYAVAAVQLSTGRPHYAVATFGGGVVILDADGGHVDTLLDAAALHERDMVLGIHQDHQGGLWLALNDGLVRVVTPSPLTRFAPDGLDGSAVSAVQEIGGRLYAATASGLFTYGEAGGAFEAVEGLDRFDPQVWGMSVSEGSDVLVAASSGLYALRDGRLVRISLVDDAFVIHRSRSDPSVAYIGTKTRLLHLERSASGWAVTRTALEKLGEIRGIVEDDTGRLWIAHRSGGLVLYDPSTGEHSSLASPGLVPQGYLAVARVGTRLVATNGDGEVSVLRMADGTVLPSASAAIEATLRDMGSGPISVATQDSTRLVLARGPSVRVLELASEGVADRTPPVLFTLPATVRRVQPGPRGHLWMVTEEGLLHYDPAVAERLSSPFAALVREVRVGGVRQSVDKVIEVAYADREIQFDVAAPAFSLSDRTEYQVRLDGYDDAWSAWSSTSFKEYTSLPEGSYVFRARARSAQGVISNETRVRFTVLPPWYRTWWAYLIYSGLALALVWTVSAWRVRSHRRRLAVQSARSARLRRLNQRLVLTNDALRASDKLKTDLLANTSHELRTPLTAILGFSEMLLDSADPEARDLAQGIQRGGDRLLTTVNGLLDMFKLQSGTLDLSPTSVDVAELARATVGLLQPLATERGLDLRVYPSDLALPACLDRDAFDRITTNLVGNALKFTNEGGVTATIDADEAFVTLSVADSGIGIEEAFLPNLFTPFEQASTGLARTHEGTGLGLSIVRRLVDLMGGRIRVDSTVGVGTLIQVQVPRWAAPAQVEASASSLVQPSLTDGQVLSVELEAPERESLRQCVEPSGTLCHAESIGRALREMRREAFDAVFVQAADADAKRVGLLRGVPGYAHTPIIRVGGEPLPVGELSALGFSYQVAAPLDEEALTRLLETVLMHLDIALVVPRS